MARVRRLALLAVALLLVAVIVLRERVTVVFLRSGIVGASTAAEELDALCRANRWIHRGLAPTYAVASFDSAGVEVHPTQDGRFDRVAKIRLTWSTGQEVERTLLSRKPLDCVFGE